MTLTFDSSFLSAIKTFVNVYTTYVTNKPNYTPYVTKTDKPNMDTLYKNVRGIYFDVSLDLCSTLTSRPRWSILCSCVIHPQ